MCVLSNPWNLLKVVMKVKAGSWAQERHFVMKSFCFFIHFTEFVSIPVPCFHLKFLGSCGCLPNMTPAHTVGVQCMSALVHANGSGWSCDRVETDNKMTNELFSVISYYQICSLPFFFNSLLESEPKRRHLASHFPRELDRFPKGI